MMRMDAKVVQRKYTYPLLVTLPMVLGPLVGRLPGASGNSGLLGPLLDAAAAAAAAAKLARELPFKKGVLLMNGDNPLSNISWAAAGGNAEAAAIAAVAGQKFGSAAVADR